MDQPAPDMTTSASQLPQVLGAHSAPGVGPTTLCAEGAAIKVVEVEGAGPPGWGCPPRLLRGDTHQ